MILARVKVKIKVTFTPAGSKSMTSVTFTPASVKKKALAPLHRHAKRLKLCMCILDFHHDNAPVHTSAVATAKLVELGYELLPHPPYSPDLAPCDFFLFPNMEARDQESNLDAYEMTPNPCARGGGAVVDNPPST